MIVDEMLTDERIGKDEQGLQNLRDAGHLSGWWRRYSDDQRQIEIVSGANIYASSRGASDMANADVPSSFVEYPSNGKSRPVLTDVVFGDQSAAAVFESPDDTHVTASVSFRTGAITGWIYVSALPNDLSPELFAKLIYAQLARSRSAGR